MFNYNWNLAEGYPSKGIEKHNSKVFSTFACGGGSSMGYKLAGYEVIGANDIDPQMESVYKLNHNPKYFFKCPIKDLITKELPEELFNLDILDGSPPCSTFSTVGDREKNWGKDKIFREGQAKQILDDLFFDFIKLTERLKPKIVIAENVKGILQGKAKGYTIEIVKQLDNIGYQTQVFLLNSATMGLPQRRERTFFIGYRKELNLPKLKLNFNEKMIPFREISDDNDKKENCTVLEKVRWNKAKEGESVGKFMAIRKVVNNLPLYTICAGNRNFHYKYQRTLNNKELKLGGSFPQDYNFNGIDPCYLIGMSVPPVMMAQVSYYVYLQWIKYIKRKV